MTRSGGEEAAAPRPVRGTLRLAFAAVVQVGVMAGVLFLYGYGRHLADGRPADAFANARWLWDAERALRLPDESSLQEWALGWDGWVRAANEYYVRVHFPGTTAPARRLGAARRVGRRPVRAGTVAVHRRRASGDHPLGRGADGQPLLAGRPGRGGDRRRRPVADVRRGAAARS